MRFENVMGKIVEARAEILKNVLDIDLQVFAHVLFVKRCIVCAFEIGKHGLRFPQQSFNARRAFQANEDVEKLFS